MTVCEDPLADAVLAADAAVWFWDPETDAVLLDGRPMPVLSFLGCFAEPSRATVGQMLLSLRPDRLALKVQYINGEHGLLKGRWHAGCATGLLLALPEALSTERDGLTGLYARHALIKHLDERLRQGGVWQVIVCDLDRLKRLNENLGHDRADLVLSTLAARLLARFGWDALPARVGEDEFAVCLPGDLEQPDAVLRATLEQPIRIAGIDVYPSFSVGLTRSCAEADTAAECLRRAEVATHQAKSAGGGHEVEYAAPPQISGPNTLSVESDLRQALERGEIEPFFQPIVDVASGRPVGVEALMRWRHPTRGLLPPDDFLALAADVGLLRDMGRTVLLSSVMMLKSWHDTIPGAKELYASVNLSGRELDRAGLVSDVRNIMARTGLPAGSLRLEITEQQILPHIEKTATILQNLKDAGASIALDDFGAGFSSLSYLAHLPIDMLKIDRYFVRTMPGNIGSAMIVRSVIDLARSFNLGVVAEGVETEEMAGMLRNFGCEQAQGYRYAAAMPASEIQVYLRECLNQQPGGLRASG
jgi:c-di-GMP-specific phosphodiesterase